MTPQERLLATAQAEIGYLEKKTNAQLDDKTANAGSGNWTKYARDLDSLRSIYNGRKNGFNGAMCLWIGASSPPSVRPWAWAFCARPIKGLGQG